MRTFTFELGAGGEREIAVVAYSVTFAAPDLPAAVAQAKELVRARPPSRQENAALIRDADRALVWTPSVDFLRNG